MDRTWHLTEDAEGIIIAGGISSFDDAIAATIIVTLKDSFMSNRRPVMTGVNNRDIELSLLLEVETARVAAFIDIVGKV